MNPTLRILTVLILASALKGADVAEISNRFFAKIDLERTELAAVRSAYMSGSHTQALDAYKDIFIDRMALLNLGTPDGFWSQGATSASMAYSGTIKMDAMGTGYCTYSIGIPGNVQWFPLVDCYIDFGRDVSSMHWTGIIVKGYMSGQPVSYLTRFCDYWNDFGINWMGQRPTNGYPYSDTLHWAWKSGLYLAWRTDNFMRFFSAACTYNPAQAKTAVSGEKLANILNQLTALEIPDLAGYRYPNVPNQQVTAIAALLKASAALSDFKDAAVWRAFALDKAQQYVTAGSYLADGSDQEQSFNYNAGLIGSAEQMIDLINQIMPDDVDAQQIAAKLEQVRIYRTRFLEMLKSPIGATPAAGTSAMTVPSVYNATAYDNFTSICFPYGGYSILRSGWERNALYAFFKSSRIGYGHYVEDGLHLTLCAYGKNLLIAGGPNSYSGETADIYYRSSFSRNTIAVDGYGQTSRQGNQMPAEGYPAPIDALWHTSSDFDFSEGVYPYGYGDKITDVIHKRKVLHIRQMGMFVVTDRLSTNNNHNYSLTWGFDSSFAAGNVIYDAPAKKIYTNRSGDVNLMIRHFTPANLSFQTYRGDSANWLGWYTPASGHNNNIPKTDCHIRWSGSGTQQIISLLYPHNGLSGEIQTVTSFDNGFDLITRNGDSLCYRAAAASQSLVAGGVGTVADLIVAQNIQGGPLRGIVTGASNKSVVIDGVSMSTGCENFEFSFDSQKLSIVPITKPEFFQWHENAVGLYPLYNSKAAHSNAPVVWWNMEQPLLNRLPDAGGLGFDAVFSGSPIWHNDGGLRAGAAEFDGVDDSGRICGDYPPPLGASGRTVALWVKVAGKGTAVCWGQNVPSGLWAIKISEEGTVDIDVDGGLIRGSGNIRDGVWHHVAVVYPEINSGWLSDTAVYIDGKRQQPAFTIDYEVATVSGETYIASNGTADYFAGMIDELLISSTAFSDEQIRNIYRYGCDWLTRPCGGLDYPVAYNLPADLNYDCRVDLSDLGMLADYWLRPTAPLAADINMDSAVNLIDFAVISNSRPIALPALWWPFTSADIVCAEDYGISELCGRLKGAPLWTDDSPASPHAIVFDGVDDCVVGDRFDLITGSAARSVCMWIKTTACGTLVSWGDDADGGQAFSLVVQANYGLPGTLAVLAGNGYKVGKTDLRDNNWHHVAAVLSDDGSADIWEAKLYVDGVEQKYSTFRSKPVDTAAGIIAVGADIHQNNRFNGAIDELRIYDRPLSSEAIRSIGKLP